MKPEQRVNKQSKEEKEITCKAATLVGKP